MDVFTEFSQYMPHGMCLLWQPWLVMLWAGSDALIFLSYMAIPMALLAVARKRSDLPHPGLVVLFASFILLCGITHLLGIITLWIPIYPAVGMVKLVTGLVSAATAIVLFRLVPQLIALPSFAQVQEVNERLQAESQAHQETLASMEVKIVERTAELKDVNAQLAVQAREAVHRSGNLLAVVSSLAQQSARSADTKEEFLKAFTGRLGALADATRSVMHSGDKSSADLAAVIEAGLGPVEQAYGERVAFAGPPLQITSEAAQQISLAMHELATNTQKYGLGRVETAHVEVSWTTKQKDEKEVLELVWREYGNDLPPLAPGSENEGFGSKLLTRIVPTMLRGDALRQFEHNGLIYRLTVPVEAITAKPDMSNKDSLAAKIVDETFGLK